MNEKHQYNDDLACVDAQLLGSLQVPWSVSCTGMSAVAVTCFLLVNTGKCWLVPCPTIGLHIPQITEDVLDEPPTTITMSC